MKSEAETKKKATEMTRQDYRHRLALSLREWEANNIIGAEQLLDGCDPELRGWEWDYARRLFHQELRILDAGGDPFGITFNPDGSRLIAICTHWAWEGGYGRGRLWDSRTGQPLQSMAFPEPFTPNASSVAFSPEGKRAAVAGSDGKVFVRDLTTDAVHVADFGPERRAAAVAFSPDGNRIAGFFGRVVAEKNGPMYDRAGWVGGEVVIWEVASGKIVTTILQKDHAVMGLAFSPDGKRLAGAVPWGTAVKVWDIASGQELMVLRGHSFQVWGVAYSRDGTRIASGSDDGAVKLWDANTGQHLRTFHGHTSNVHALEFSSDGKRLASGSDDASVRIWDTETALPLLTLRGHRNSIRSVRFSPDGQQLASASSDGTVRVWDALAARDGFNLGSHQSRWAGAFSADGKRLVWGNGFSVYLADATTGQSLTPIHMINFANSALALSRDSKFMVTGGSDLEGGRNLVALWDPVTGKQTRTLGQHLVMVSTVALSPDDRLVASAGEDGVRLWETETGKQRFEFTGQATPWPRCARFSPDSRRLAAVRANWSIEIRDTSSGELLHTLQGKGVVNDLAFNSDGNWLASAGSDGMIRIWDAVKGTEVATLNGHAKGTTAVVFSPNGRRLVTAGNDRTLKVWNTATFEEVITLRNSANQLAFSPDGTRLMSGSADGIRVWDGTPDYREEKIPWSFPDNVFLRNWLVLAPLPLEVGETPEAGLERAQLSEEAKFSPKANDTVTVRGKTLEWKRVSTSGPLLDFNGFCGGVTPNSVAYAVCYLVCDKEHTGLTMCLGSDDQAKIYFNGTEVFKQLKARYAEMDQDMVQHITLRKGTNVIVFKVVNGIGDWGGCVRFADKSGKPFTDFKVKLSPE